MDTEQRLEELENSVVYLLIEIEGKSKLLKLIDALQKENEELSTRCSKLICEKVLLEESLSAANVRIKRLSLLLDHGRNQVLLDKLASIVDLLEQAELQTDNLIADYRIE